MMADEYGVAQFKGKVEKLKKVDSSGSAIATEADFREHKLSGTKCQKIITCRISIVLCLQSLCVSHSYSNTFQIVHIRNTESDTDRACLYDQYSYIHFVLSHSAVRTH